MNTPAHDDAGGLMDPTAGDIAGIRALADAQQALDDEAADQGLEFVGREHGTNRAGRRANIKALKALTRRPDGDKRWLQPLLQTLTPYAVKERRRRRRAEAIAKASRRVNMRRARGHRT